MRGELILNKWCFKLGIIPIYWRRNGLFISFGIFKLISIPPEGQQINKKHYKGFWLKKDFEFKGFEINIILKNN